MRRALKMNAAGRVLIRPRLSYRIRVISSVVHCASAADTAAEFILWTQIFALSRAECEVLRSACLYVCLSTRTFQNHTSFQTSRNFQYVLPAARSYSDDSVMCYVLPVLWTTSYFHIIRHV